MVTYETVANSNGHLTAASRAPAAIETVSAASGNHVSASSSPKNLILHPADRLPAYQSSTSVSNAVLVNYQINSNSGNGHVDHSVIKMPNLSDFSVPQPSSNHNVVDTDHHHHHQLNYMTPPSAPCLPAQTCSNGYVLIMDRNGREEVIS